jgi:hypothetical protein
VLIRKSRYPTASPHESFTLLGSHPRLKVGIGDFQAGNASFAEVIEEIVYPRRVSKK